MHKMLKVLCAVGAVFFVFTSISHADSAGLGIGSSMESTNQNPMPVKPPILNNLQAIQNNVRDLRKNVPSPTTHLYAYNNAVSNKHRPQIAAVDYHSLPQNLTPQNPRVLAEETGEPTDCTDGEGILKSGGAFGETIVCPTGYIPRSIWSTEKPTGSALGVFIKNIIGTVYLHMRCCKAHVIYS